MLKTLPLPEKPRTDMARKKTDSTDLNRQVNFRVTDAFYARIETTASTLGLDVANFIRMVLAESMAIYEDRAAHVRQRKEK